MSNRLMDTLLAENKLSNILSAVETKEQAIQILRALVMEGEIWIRCLAAIELAERYGDKWADQHIKNIMNGGISVDDVVSGLEARFGLEFIRFLGFENEVEYEKEALEFKAACILGHKGDPTAIAKLAEVAKKDPNEFDWDRRKETALEILIEKDAPERWEAIRLILGPFVSRGINPLLCELAEKEVKKEISRQLTPEELENFIETYLRYPAECEGTLGRANALVKREKIIECAYELFGAEAITRIMEASRNGKITLETAREMIDNIRDKLSTDSGRITHAVERPEDILQIGTKFGTNRIARTACMGLK